GNSPFFGDGGAFASDGCNAVVFTNDTITGNSSFNSGGGYYGNACFFAGGPNQPAVVTPHAKQHAVQPAVVIANSTVFLFDTITDNTSIDGNGGNITQDDSSTITLGESIVAGGISDSAAQNCEIDNFAPGSFTSNGYNLIDDTTCGTPGTGDIIGQSPQLGALGANGGPTNTELPATGSPAIGGVPATVCTATGVTTDQRGNARGAGLNGTCTIGSVEVSVAAPSLNLNGYRLVANEGGIFDFGLNFHGSLANNHLNAPIVGIANSPGYDGYLMAGGDGGVFALGGANFYGSLGGQKLPSPISAIAAPPAENGYWLVAQNGKIYNFGAAPALPAVQVPSGAHIVGMASTQDGGGGWLTDNLGDVYAEGDALYVGGLGGVHLNAPIVGIAAAASGQGYALAASDGGVFNYGTQHFFGSVPGSLAPGQKLVAPIVGIAVTHSGNGYWLVGSDGGVFNYGDAPFLGSIYTAIGNHPLNGPIVGIQHLGELPTA
ncbi:MAG TPA: choice-of-anchor Q domain-containing protein, partial [Acidimicrobiales bacterium]|nr:choice-of-anchor Q domain-containing protein [Acidimicrobiales bacterium]